MIGVGAKKFDMSLETREIKLFGRDIPGFCRDILEVPEKFEKKFVFNFWPLSECTGDIANSWPPNSEQEVMRRRCLQPKSDSCSSSLPSAMCKTRCIVKGPRGSGRLLYLAIVWVILIFKVRENT